MLLLVEKEAFKIIIIGLWAPTRRAVHVVALVSRVPAVINYAILVEPTSGEQQVHAKVGDVMRCQEVTNPNTHPGFLIEPDRPSDGVWAETLTIL